MLIIRYLLTLTTHNIFASADTIAAQSGTLSSSLNWCAQRRFGDISTDPFLGMGTACIVDPVVRLDLDLPDLEPAEQRC